MFNGRKLLEVMLLDTESTCSIFGNAKMLSNIKKASHALDLHANGGILTIKRKGDTTHFGRVWYDHKAITNVLSFHEMKKESRSQEHRV